MYYHAIMTEISTERRFRGSVRLVTLHLWRIAQSTDVEKGFAKARELGYFDSSNEEFVRNCFAIDEALERGDAPSQPIGPDVVKKLQLCAIKLNSADPA